MNYKSFVFATAMVTTVGAMAQHTDAMLFGDVKSKETGEHLAYAAIRVKGTKIITRCDASGHFSLNDLPTGRQTLVASLVGYKSQEIVVTLERNKATNAFFSLETDAMNVEQVVVTGTRTSHFVKNVPIRTEVLTSEAIVKKNAQNIYAALEGTPGVRVEQQCQACNFSMVRMQGLGAEHTQVLLDGQPVYSGLAGVYGLEQMGTNDVDRLEIVKGAGSAFYGSSAVAGAINIISKEPTYTPSVNADVQFGNWGHRVYNGSGSMRHKNIGLSVYAQRMEQDAVDATQDGATREEVKHKDGVSDRVYTRLTNLGFGAYFFSPFAMNDKLVIRGKAIDEERKGGQIKDDLYLNPFSEGTENIATNRLTADMAYTLPFGRNSEFNFSMAYVYHRRNATNDTYLMDYRTHLGTSPDVNDMRPYLAKEHTYTPSATLTFGLNNHTVLVGAQGYFTRLRETGSYLVVDNTSPYYKKSYTSLGKKHAHEFGFFVQDEWNVLPNLTVVPGVRLDVHSSGEEYSSSEQVFDSSFPKTKFSSTIFNPRLAVKYEVSSALVLRANIGTGFRAPYGFSEDLHLCSGSPRVWKSSALKGEKSLSYNLSADYYGSNYQVSVNLFRTNLKNKITFGDAGVDATRLGYTYEWVNVGDAYTQGIELGLKWRFLRNVQAGVNWTFNKGKYDNVRSDWDATAYAEDSKYISRFPNMTGDFTLDYTPGTWTFSLSSSLQGRMYIDYLAEQTADRKIKKTNTFALFNLRVAKRIGDHFTIYAGGRNIFSYVQDERHTDDAAFMYAPVYGATWYGGISLSF